MLRLVPRDINPLRQTLPLSSAAILGLVLISVPSQLNWQILQRSLPFVASRPHVGRSARMHIINNFNDLWNLHREPILGTSHATLGCDVSSVSARLAPGRGPICRRRLPLAHLAAPATG